VGAERVQLVDAVVELAGSFGHAVETPVMLRSTNNIVVWLAPSQLIAKIAADGDRRLGDELAAGQALAKLAAPTAPPADVLGDRVHRIESRDVTFWRNVGRNDGRAPSSQAVTGALVELHAALRRLNGEDLRVRRSVADVVSATLASLDDPSFAPSLAADDRRLLQHALSSVTANPQYASGQLIHGSPHRFNIVGVDGRACFVDLETIALGPVEWDLAHLEDEVANSYAGPVDGELLARCRIGISALTAAQCWHSLDRGPDMIDHARHHLDVVRSSTT
jgi:hypothetical protein